MHFGTEYFWFQFLVKNATCSIFVPVYGTSFLVRIFGVDFWYMIVSWALGIKPEPKIGGISAKCQRTSLS